ncbi:MAG: hypothetical protein M1812_003236 [Candelaria pacifica]|nr:MAG: hypothetical protein M1812_003236 [Candelaria pacifica]
MRASSTLFSLSLILSVSAFPTPAPQSINPAAALSLEAERHISISKRSLGPFCYPRLGTVSYSSCTTSFNTIPNSIEPTIFGPLELGGQVSLPRFFWPPRTQRDIDGTAYTPPLNPITRPQQPPAPGGGTSANLFIDGDIAIALIRLPHPNDPDTPASKPGGWSQFLSSCAWDVAKNPLSDVNLGSCPEYGGADFQVTNDDGGGGGNMASGGVGGADGKVSCGKQGGREAYCTGDGDCNGCVCRVVELVNSVVQFGMGSLIVGGCAS